MGRPLRLEFPARSITSLHEVADERISTWKQQTGTHSSTCSVCERFNWAIRVYCLMSNHYHLLVETLDANLAMGMCQLNGVYTQRFNRRHLRIRHVFQGRYQAIVVERDAYALELARYVVLNPMRARLARSAKDWPWSSYCATAGLATGPPWLQTGWLLSSYRPQSRHCYAARKSIRSTALRFTV